MGRPSFNIDTSNLRHLREKEGLTQAELAEQIGIHEVTYQKCEANGNTSRKTAEKLAKIFRVSVETLQQGIEYPDTADYLAKIENSIRKALEHGGNTLLEHALQHELDHTSFMSSTPAENRNDAIRYLAHDIATRIESVQLVRNKKEISNLLELTGLSETELLRPASVEGLWFINISQSWQQEPCAAPEEFNSDTKLVQRANWAIGTIKDAVEDSLKFRDHCSDESVQLQQNGFWYQIEVKHPWTRQKIRIDLVRCQPEANGLRWVKPSWRDEYLIRNPLGYWAKKTFNFVTDFDGKQLPSGDIRNLRLLLTEYNLNDQWFPRPTGRMVISGNLGEMNDEMLTSFQNQGQAHLAIQNWLTDDLKYTLAPLLADYPRECWSVRGLSIDLDENRSNDRKRPILERYFGKKYSIELVEQLEDGKFEPVPWREKDRNALEESIQKMLDAPNDPAWTTYEPRRTFAPYSGEP